MGSGNVEDNLTERRKFTSISELETFVAMEGTESDILEWKDYNMAVWEDQRDDILKAVCGLANNKGGYFLIGFDNDGKTVYSNIDYDVFTEKLDNWVNDLVEPRGVRYSPDRVTDDSRQCIVVYVDTSPGACYALRIRKAYRFPYRTYGSTRFYSFEDFFKIYVHKFLKDVAVSGEFVKGEEEPPLISFVGGRSEEGPFDSELVNNYVDMLKTMELSSESAYFLMQSISNEAYKVFHKREIDEENLPVIENLVEFACEFMKDKDENVMKRILNILILLTRAPQTLEVLQQTCFEYLKGLYEKGERHKDLVKILDACGHFGDRIDEIMKAIENREQELLDILVSRMDFEEIRENRFELIKELVAKMDALDPDKDKVIVDKIIYIIRQLRT